MLFRSAPDAAEVLGTDATVPALDGPDPDAEASLANRVNRGLRTRDAGRPSRDAGRHPNGRAHVPIF